MSPLTGWGWLAWVNGAVWCVDSDPYSDVGPYSTHHSTGPPTVLIKVPAIRASVPLTCVGFSVKAVAQPVAVKANSASAVRPRLAIAAIYAHRSRCANP